MQKFITISVICLILLITFGCSAKKPDAAVNTNTVSNTSSLSIPNTNADGSLNYDNIKTLLTDYLAATNALNTAVKPNADPKVVGQALSDYTTKMKDYSPRLKDLTGNHPDFIANPPADMKQLVADYQGSADTLKTIFTNLVPFMQDPVVAEAIKNL